jgi:hypothetical protein
MNSALFMAAREERGGEFLQFILKRLEIFSLS